MFALSSYSANEALDLLNGELHRSRTNMSIDTVLMYLKLIQNIERAYTDYDEVMPLTQMSVLLDKLSYRNERRRA